jgi:hypothetical protein
MSKEDQIVKKLQLKIDQVTRTQSVLNQNQIQKLWNSTPKRYKYSRPGKAGGTYSYVKVNYVRQVLDSVFGFNWSFDVETSLAEAFEVAKITKTCIVKGVLTGKVKIDGEWIELRKTQFGRAEVKFKRNSTDTLDFGADMKAATSDALKKCASLLGVAADLYAPDEFQEIEIIGADENTDRAKATESKLAEAKKVIKEQGTKV